MPSSGSNPERNETSFEAAIGVEPIDGSNTLFTGHIPWDWAGQYAAWGGYIAGLLCQTAKTYLALTQNPSRPPQPDPINSHVQLLSGSTPGPVRLKVTLLKPGSRVSIVQVEVQKPVKSIGAADNADYKTSAIGIITMGNLALERGVTLKLPPTLERGDIPDREKKCFCLTLENDPDMADMADHAPVGGKFETWYVNGFKDGMMNDRFGLSVREKWCSRADGKEFDIMALVALCDWFGGAPGNFSPHYADLKAGLLYPTLSMTTEVKKNPKGARWLFLRCKTHVIRNGRADSDIWVFDESGNMMAMSKHVSLVAEGRLAGKDEEIRKLFLDSKI